LNYVAHPLVAEPIFRCLHLGVLAELNRTAEADLPPKKRARRPAGPHPHSAAAKDMAGNAMSVPDLAAILYASTLATANSAFQNPPGHIDSLLDTEDMRRAGKLFRFLTEDSDFGEVYQKFNGGGGEDDTAHEHLGEMFE
jgi:hypothetical protein